MRVTLFVQLGSNKFSNVPTLRDMQHELHSLIDERNLVRRVNDGRSFHVLQLTVDASIRRRVAHVTINLRFVESLLRYVNQSQTPCFKICEEDNRALLGEAQGVTS